jgi:signal transduction histidine kinase
VVRKPIETAKSPAERAFELLKDAPLGVLLVDQDLRIREANDAARETFAWAPAAIGREVREVAEQLHARGGVLCYLGGAQETESAPPRVAELLPSANGGPNSTSRAKDDFLATVSHELRSPLQGILGWLTLLQGGRLDAAQTTRALQSVERSVRLQAQLVNDIMDIARIESGKVEIDKAPVDLSQLLRTTAEEFLPQARARRIELQADAKPCGVVIGDRERLHQLFANLLSNALKFTPTGGSVTLSCTRENGEIVTKVADSGHGIDADFMPHLFKRFSQADTSITRRFGGLGLGLAIVRHLVELHGGKVSVRNRDEGGAIFTISLPQRRNR